MSDHPPPDATVQLSVEELDAIFEAARPMDRDPVTGMEAAHFAGEAKASEAMHRQIIETADILIE